MNIRICAWLGAVSLALTLSVAPPARADRDLDRALFEASLHRVPERVAELLEKGANPNFEDSLGVTPPDQCGPARQSAYRSFAARCGCAGR